MSHLYFFVYRVRADGPLPGNGLEQPTGGLVLPARDVVHAVDVAQQRYHCAPYEALVLEEVELPEQKWKARCLDRAWTLNFREFQRIMSAA